MPVTSLALKGVKPEASTHFSSAGDAGVGGVPIRARYQLPRDGPDLHRVFRTSSSRGTFSFLRNGGRPHPSTWRGAAPPPGPALPRPERSPDSGGGVPAAPGPAPGTATPRAAPPRPPPPYLIPPAAAAPHRRRRHRSLLASRLSGRRGSARRGDPAPPSAP
ncbi:unnamed protein product, partial [Bubo scandiacus]